MQPAARQVLQLFNGNGKVAPGAPNHLAAEPLLERHGLIVRTLASNSRPWNPLARAHNAYAGLDPLRALRVLLTLRRVDCVCGHMESLVVILMLRRLFLFRPKVVLWEVPWSPGWAYRERVMRLAIPRADMNIVFSRSQLDLLRDAFGHGVRALAIPFCVDTEFYRPQGQAEDGYVLSCGRDSGRDFQIVVEAVRDTPHRLLLRTNNAVALQPDRDGTVTLVREHLGWPEYRALYDRAAVVVVAAHETPNASGVTSLLEALAMGKAVIVTATSPLADYLPPADAGVVVAAGDPAAMRAAIAALMDDPARRRAMGERARRFALERFSPAPHFDAIGRMLNAVMDAA